MKVPLLKQTKMMCGPTSLAMVLKYYKKNISPKKIIKAIGGLNKYGTRTVDLAEFAKSEGFKVTCYTWNPQITNSIVTQKIPTKKLIINFLKKDIPVIISVRSWILFNKKQSRMGHSLIITNYKNKTFYYNDPKDGKQHKVDEDKLMFAWFAHVTMTSAYLIAIKQ